MSTVFLSHASADSAVAAELCTQLELLGVQCWVAPRDVRAGVAYGEAIIDGINRSDCLVLLLTARANASDWVAREVERAVSKKKRVLVVRHEPVQIASSLELFIASNQWLPPAPSIAGVAAHVARALGSAAPQPVRPRSSRAPVLAAAVAVVVGIGGWLAWSRHQSERGVELDTARRTAGGPLELTWRVLAQRVADAPFAPVKEGEVLHTGARMAFEVKVSEPAHVFVCQRTKGKQVEVLFPNRRIELANPLPANLWVRLPPEKAFRLNDENLGVETVYLLAARTPPQSLLEAIQESPRQGPAVEQQLVELSGVSAACAAHPGVTLDGEANCGLVPRGLELEDAASDGASHRIRAKEDDGVVLVPFRWEHLP